MLRLLAAGLAALLMLAAPASAQPWPSKPITIVQGFSAGSGLDIVARVMQAPLEKILGQPIVFDYNLHWMTDSDRVMPGDLARIASMSAETFLSCLS